ncbi:MAG: molybdopterin-dependent oxidoreductase [Anaerolineae bacterium]|jgi:DMSO/TMAO reductase YedYZ molybdopterin-dependent catalytic subunit
MTKKTALTLWTIIVSVALLVGCKPTPTASPTPQPPDAKLEIVSGEQSVTLNWEDIQALPAYEGVGGRISSVGHVTPPAKFKGVTLEDLCGLVGGITEENSISVVAKDGYAMTLSYNQITTGDFPTYDPSTGDESPFDGKLWVVVAYEEEGALIPADGDGPLRLAILGSQKLVTDGHWWIKWVEKIEIKQSLENWTLHLEGALSEDIDRGTFETGAAPGCHGTNWTDADGQTWTGIPLWLLVGRVDDDNTHEDGAFNDELAAAGYEIKVTAADGYSISFDSADIARNNDILVAYLLDDEPLPEDYWPLRLVGPEIGSSMWVSNITTIEIVLP